MLHNAELDGRFSDSAVLGAFGRLEPDLAAFAEKHSLFVRKYIHNYPMWGFYFLHPSGGRGAVQLTIIHKAADEFAATVGGEWHVDDDDKLVRSTYSVPLENLPSAQPALVVRTLEDVLGKILTAPESVRTRISRIMERRKDDSGKPVYGEFEQSLQIAK
jgi:hypothetical protein